MLENYPGNNIIQREEKMVRYRPEYNLKIIGNNLKRLREENGLSVKEVKEYLRLGSVQAIYKYENGKGYPPTDTMFALMELYGANLSDIINEHFSASFPNKVIQHFVGEYFLYDCGLNIEIVRNESVAL